MKAKLLQFLIVIKIFCSLKAKEIFMSTEGSDDTGDSSIENPYLSMMRCQKVAKSGDIIYIRGGTYINFDIASSTSTYNYIHYFSKSGLTYKAYESEK